MDEEEDAMPDKQIELVSAVAAEAGIKERARPELPYLTKKELLQVLACMRALRAGAERVMGRGPE